MPRFSELIENSHFADPELIAMRSDGEIYRAASTWSCSDQALTPELKAAVVVRDLGDDFAPSGLSALWIHGLSPEPQKHSLAMRGRSRPIDSVLETRTIRDLGPLCGKTVHVGTVECVDAQTSFAEVLRDPRVIVSDILRMKPFISVSGHELQNKCKNDLVQLSRVPYTELMKSRLETILR